jgi:ribosome-associated protein
LDEKTLALTIAKHALDKQAQDLEIINVSKFVDYADFVLVCGGRSERQVRAIAEAILGELKAAGQSPCGVEGLSQGAWVLIDYGSVVVHVLLEQARSYYDIEGLWLDAERVSIEPLLERAEAGKNQRGRCASGS